MLAGRFRSGSRSAPALGPLRWRSAARAGHVSHRSDAFDEDLQAYVDTHPQPGNLQGGFDWYAVTLHSRGRLIHERAPKMPCVDAPTCERWGASDPVLLPDFTDWLANYFSDIDVAAA